jgi:hypothetical protein
MPAECRIKGVEDVLRVAGSFVLFGSRHHRRRKCRAHPRMNVVWMLAAPHFRSAPFCQPSAKQRKSKLEKFPEAPNCRTHAAISNNKASTNSGIVRGLAPDVDDAPAANHSAPAMPSRNAPTARASAAPACHADCARWIIIHQIAGEMARKDFRAQITDGVRVSAQERQQKVTSTRRGDEPWCFVAGIWAYPETLGVHRHSQIAVPGADRASNSRR